MNSYKMISAALLAGLMTACVITDGSTDSATGGGSTTGSSVGTGTDGTSGSSGGTGTGTDGTGTSSDVPTTDAPTSSTSVGSSSTGSSTGGGSAMCGWDPGNMYYDCGFEGEDPSGTIPLGCPEGLVEGEACGSVPGEGCCDANGDNWYCGDDGGAQILVKVGCSG